MLYDLVAWGFCEAVLHGSIDGAYSANFTMRASFASLPSAAQLGGRLGVTAIISNTTRPCMSC